MAADVLLLDLQILPETVVVMRPWERLTHLARAIDRLPGKLRLALELHLPSATYRDIGEQLAITEKNAFVRVSRARTTLKQSFCPES